MYLVSTGKIKPGDAALYSIVLWMSEDGPTQTKINRLAKKIHCSRQTTSTMLKRLEMVGLISIRFDGRWTRLEVLDFLTPATNIVHSYHEQCSHRTPYIKDTLEKHCRRSRNSIENTGNSSGSSFFPEYEYPSPQNKTTALDRLLASRLYEAVQESGRFTGRKFNREKWADQFRILRSYYDSHEIEQVLNWYCNNLEDAYIPKAYSALSFKRKYDRIKECLERDTGPIDIDINEDAQWIIDYLLANFSWPKDSRRKIPWMVQQGIDEICKFNRLLIGVAKSSSYINEEADILQRLLFPAGPLEFVQQWFEEVSAEITRWKRWPGNMEPYKLHVGNKRFVLKCKECLRSYGYNENQSWKLIKDELKGV